MAPHTRRYLFPMVCVTPSMLGTHVNAGPLPGAQEASVCEHAMTCPRFDDVYASHPPFRFALATSLRHGKEKVPGCAKDELERNNNMEKDSEAILYAGVIAEHTNLEFLESPITCTVGATDVSLPIPVCSQ